MTLKYYYVRVLICSCYLRRQTPATRQVPFFKRTCTMIDSILEVPVMTTNRIKELFAQPTRSTVEVALYEYACTGLSAIMFDRMTQAQVRGLVTGEKVDYPKDEPLELKALRKMYSDKYENDMPVGALGIPNENFCAALRDTGKKVKYGQGTWDFITSGTNGTLLYCMIRLAEPFIVLRDLEGNPVTKDQIKVDCRKGNATQGTGAVGIIRPRMDEWGFAGHLFLAVSGEYVLPERQLERLINMAGLRAGLCSGRPGMQMPFGQFVLRHLKHIGGAKPREITISEANGEPKKRATRKKATLVENGEVAGHLNGDPKKPGEGEPQSTK